MERTAVVLAPMRVLFVSFPFSATWPLSLSGTLITINSQDRIRSLPASKLIKIIMNHGTAMLIHAVWLIETFSIFFFAALALLRNTANHAVQAKANT